MLRAERNWTQEDLAGALGVSRQTINAIERGRYDPSLPLAFAIANIYGKNIEDIFQPDDTIPVPGEPTGRKLNL